MSRAQALADLLAKVEAGDDITAHHTSRIFNPGYAHAINAASGSLDAALALHNAVLPMWEARVKVGADGNPSRAFLTSLTPVSGKPSSVVAWGIIPARVWLCAILTALIEGATE